jgi:hypothetical protein
LNIDCTDTQGLKKRRNGRGHCGFRVIAQLFELFGGK